MGHPVEYDSGSSLAIFLRISFFFFSRFSPLFHDFFLKVFLSFFQQEHVRNDEQFFSFFQLCLSLFSSSLFQYLRAWQPYVCVSPRPHTQFSKIVSIEGRFCSSFTILSSCFVFSLGACFRGFEWVPFSKSYLISSWVVVIKS